MVGPGDGVGGGVIGTVGVGGSVTGAVVVGAALVGAGVVGRTVRDVALAVGEADVLAVADGDDETPAGPIGRPRTIAPMTSIVSRLPATAASARSTQRGPRRGGGMTLVVSACVSVGTGLAVAGPVPPAQAAFCRVWPVAFGANSARERSGSATPTAMSTASVEPSRSG